MLEGPILLIAGRVRKLRIFPSVSTVETFFLTRNCIGNYKPDPLRDLHGLSTNRHTYETEHKYSNRNNLHAWDNANHDG